MISTKQLRLFSVFILFCLNFTFASAEDLPVIKSKSTLEGQNNPETVPQSEGSQLFLDEGDYYLARGEKIPLRRDPRRIAVKFKVTVLSNLREAADQTMLQSDILQQALATVNINATLTVEKQLINKGITILNAKSPSTSSQRLFRSQIQEIAAADTVEFANPVYTSKRSINEIIPTDEILIRFTPEYGQAEVESFCETHNLTFKRKTISKLNIFALSVNDLKSRSTLNVANSLNGRRGVVWSQPNFIQKIELNSVNDPLYPDQWHLENRGQGGGTEDSDVDAEEAWAVQTGNPDIAIAIIDNGVDLDHEDLDIWTNPNETPNNDIDDDQNGYVDDTNGWNFHNDTNNPDADYDSHHGTACTGVAAAKGNNGIGVAGIAYGCKILPVKISGDRAGEFATEEDIAKAILYAADHADVISCSWGVAPNTIIMDAIDYAVENGRDGKGCPVFVASGNGAALGIEYSIPVQWHSSDPISVGWVYENTGPENFGENAAWLDQIELGGDTITFEEVTPPALPENEDWDFEGDTRWETVYDSQAVGDISLKSGSVSQDQYSAIILSRNLYETETIFTYRVWMDAGPDDFLAALFHDGEEWQPYEIFRGKGLSFPASYDGSIAVGASSDLNRRSPYSQYGDELDFVAPSSGGNRGITTTDRTGSAGYSDGAYTSDFSGTSSATPLAAGIAALILSKDPNLTASEVRNIMTDSCDKIGDDDYDNGWNMYYGYGKVNAYRAVNAIAQAVDNNDDDNVDDNSSGGGGGCFISTL
jgi:subtilisin family serine protease